jgi:hypothetical protein
MNWIIRKSQKISCHTVLGEILKPLEECIDSYNWIISDIDGGGHYELPINYEEDYFILSPDQLKQILNSHFQFYWGAILAIPKSVDINLDEDNLPYVEGNPHIFENGHIQHPDAEIEIDCFDSGYTIVKFSNEILSDKFKSYFEEALSIDKFNSNYIH